MRLTPRRIVATIVASVVLLAAGTAHSVPPSLLPPEVWLLPEPLATEVRLLAERARNDPRLEPALRRAAAAAATPHPSLDWSADALVRSDLSGRVGADLDVSLRTTLYDARRAHAPATAVTAELRAQLERELAVKDAVHQWLDLRLDAWRLARQGEALEELAKLPAPKRDGERAARQELLALRPLLRFEQERLAHHLARRFASDLPPLPDGVWDALTTGPLPGGACEADAVEVRLAELALMEVRTEQRLRSGGTPTVTMGVSGAARIPELASFQPEWTARAWLEIGMPSISFGHGSIRADLGPHAVTVAARTGGRWPDVGEDPATALREAVARAERELANARFEVADRLAVLRYRVSMGPEVASFASARPKIGGAASAEAALEAAEAWSARARTRIALAFACHAP